MFGKKFLYVLRSDPRENLPLSYPVCPADDRRKSVAAVLQHCRHPDRRTRSRKQCARRRRLLLYADDVSDFHFSRPVDGRRCALFDLSGTKRSFFFKTFDSPRVSADPCRYARAESRCLCSIEPILTFLRVPDEVRPGMRTYLLIIFAGLIATSVYNFFSCMLRALGNSSVPLIFLAVSAVLNIALDLLFVAVLPFGIAARRSLRFLRSMCPPSVFCSMCCSAAACGCRQKKNGVSAIPF